jgi:hypothetical protein
MERRMSNAASDPDADNLRFAQVVAHRDDFIRIAASQLLVRPLVPVRGLTPKQIPAEAGVYMFYRVGSDRPFHIGESMNLRQRIYQNQLRGQIGQSALKRKVNKLTGLTGKPLRDYIFSHFDVRFMPLSLGRIEVEDYLNTQFGIVESRPHAAKE